MILDYCHQVEDEGNLPPLRHKSARMTDLTVIQDAGGQFSVGPHNFVNLAPIVSAQLCLALAIFSFGVSHPDDIKTVLSPSVVVDGMRPILNWQGPIVYTQKALWESFLRIWKPLKQRKPVTCINAISS